MSYISFQVSRQLKKNIQDGGGGKEAGGVQSEVCEIGGLRLD